MAYVYKITNDVNGKIYIGLTFYTIEQRWKIHIQDSVKSNCKGRPLYYAMNKYGISHFKIEQVEECDDSIVNERESYWIKFYDSYHNGYNATYGGEGRVEYDKEVIYKLYEEGKTQKEICDILHCDASVPRKVLATKGISFFEEGKQRNKELYGKKCRAITKDGEIKEFDSLSDGARYVIEKGLSIDTLHGIQVHIGQVCNGKRKTAYGMHWEFINK